MNIDFNKGNGLVPAIIQNARTQQVLMLGYMNEEAFNATVETGNVTFYSRSKERLWMKGESSGNVMHVEEIRVDCDNDTLLIKANPSGPVCHTGANTCFNETDAKGFLYQLEATISERIVSQSDDSYTSKMFRKGINKMAQKVGEEAVEVVIEAKDDNMELFENEAADLLYHLLLLLRAKNSGLENIEQILKERHRKG
ncbi:MAG: bifunctional phosphoribosyl-AMP cyclohydrolase/phosphoribosyl-ATP diphosphatase [Fluviicola sp. XM-24bin1]|nr:MAG: bifunctional phosphoribosyl-AMP cyclohydrolase/phosphoribosyl-ATP diphosphatase [Fluviicola sp. XM-24bin1]